MDAVDLGQRIRDHRERAQLNQAQLARAVALERTAVNKIEAGARKVTALELARIADVLGIRMARLFEEPLPAIVAHRSNQGLEVVDSQIDVLLAEIATEVEFVQRLSPSGSISTPEVQAHDRPRTDQDSEVLASSARKLLGLTAEQPATRLVDLVAGIGLWAFARELGSDTADAGTIQLRRGGVSLVNSSMKVGRRRLALAHELGHFLVQDDYSIDWRINDSEAGEARLDRFARAVLLPSQGFHDHWTQQLRIRDLRDAAVVTASVFQVDMATLARRVTELDLPGDVNAIRQVRTTRADIVEWGLSPSNELEGTSLPAAYERAVLALLRNEQISPERALELLQGAYGDDDLPPRRLRSEGELWKFVS